MESRSCQPACPTKRQHGQRPTGSSAGRGAPQHGQVARSAWAIRSDSVAAVHHGPDVPSILSRSYVLHKNAHRDDLRHRVVSTAAGPDQFLLSGHTLPTMAKAAPAARRGSGRNIGPKTDSANENQPCWNATALSSCSRLVMLVIVLRPAPPAERRRRLPQGRKSEVAGILFDHDRKNNWITVKADGEDEPVKYLIDPANKNLAEG